MAPDSPDTPSTQVELYELAVEMADRISDRRMRANSFFLTVNTGLAALLGGNSLRWYAAAAGIVFCISWWALLQSYRRLNWAKFEVINRIERDLLPVRIYSEEWTHLQGTSAPRKVWPPRAFYAWVKGYKELGAIERVVPLAFIAIYIAELVRQIAH